PSVFESRSIPRGASSNGYRSSRRIRPSSRPRWRRYSAGSSTGCRRMHRRSLRRASSRSTSVWNRKSNAAGEDFGKHARDAAILLEMEADAEYQRAVAHDDVSGIRQARPLIGVEREIQALNVAFGLLGRRIDDIPPGLRSDDARAGRRQLRMLQIRSDERHTIADELRLKRWTMIRRHNEHVLAVWPVQSPSRKHIERHTESLRDRIYPDRVGWRGN